MPIRSLDEAALEVIHADTFSIEVSARTGKIEANRLELVPEAMSELEAANS